MILLIGVGIFGEIIRLIIDNPLLLVQTDVNKVVGFLLCRFYTFSRLLNLYISNIPFSHILLFLILVPEPLKFFINSLLSICLGHWHMTVPLAEIHLWYFLINLTYLLKQVIGIFPEVLGLWIWEILTRKLELHFIVMLLWLFVSVLYWMLVLS